jgi:hypothetical protein
MRVANIGSRHIGQNNDTSKILKNMKMYLTLFTCILFTAGQCLAQNVGIGTATPQFRTDIADSSATTLLRLRTITNTPGSRTLVRFATTETSTVQNFNSSFAGNYLPSGGGSAFIIGTASPNLSPVERMRLDQNGFLGIGTADPLARLHLDMTTTTNSDAIIIDDDADPVVRFRRNGTDLGFFQFLDNDFKMGTSVNNDLGQLILRTNGTDRVFVNPNGNTGIGINSPAARLHVSGDIIAEDASPSLLFRATDGSTTGFFQTVGNNLLLGSAINTTTPLRFYTAGVERAIINSNGFFGYGTSSPQGDFHLDFGNSFNFEPIIANFTGGTRQIQFRRQNSPFAYMEFAQDMLSIGMYEQDNISFRTDDAERMRIGSNGKVSINTISTPGSYHLGVNGWIICTDITTLPFNQWPDYVFSPSYKLKPLNELEQYVRQNQHLPGIPSAEEIKKNGTGLGEMQRLQMEKIEELTLYILELKKEIDQLKQHRQPF